MTEKQQVEAVLFNKQNWHPAKAKYWLKSNNYRPIKPVHITERYLRYRLQKPGTFEHLRTISLKDGVKLIVGYKNT